MKYLLGKGCSYPGEQKTCIFEYKHEPKRIKHIVCAMVIYG